MLPAFRSGTLHPMDWMVWHDFGFHPPAALQSFVAGAVLEAIRRSAIDADVPLPPPHVNGAPAVDAARAPPLPAAGQ